MIDSYDALDLGTFLKIDAVLRTDADDLDKQAQIIAILSDKSLDEVLSLSLGDYASMAAQTAFLKELCKPAEIPDGYEYEGLRPVEDFTKLTAAQYIDFQTFSKHFPETIPELLTVLLVPDGHRYNDGYDIAPLLEAVKKMPLATALGLTAFFFSRCAKSIDASLTFLDGVAKRTKDAKVLQRIVNLTREVRELLPSAGAGSTG